MSPADKDLGLLVDEKLNLKKQFVPAAPKVNHVLSHIKRNVTSRAGEVILPLCFTVVRPR